MSSALLQQWLAAGERLEVFGHAIFVRRESAADGSSDAVPLVILHGFPTSSLDFHRVLPELSARRTVILHDHLGFGESAKPAGEAYSLWEQAEIAAEVWRLSGARRVHLLAHDYGTSVATELLARRERGLLPVELVSLTLTNGSMLLDLARLRLSQRIARSRFLGPGFGRLVTYGYCRRVLRKLWARPDLAREEDLRAMWEGIRRQDGHRRTHEISSYLNERVRFRRRWIGALERLDLPCQLLWGTADPVARRVIAEELGRRIPAAELSWLEDVGHFPMLEAPERFAAAVQGFLTSDRVRGPGEAGLI